MSMQEFVVDPDERICIGLLRRKYRELGLAGQCVAKFDPCNLLKVIELPGLVRVNRYGSMAPEDPLEFGFVEVFRLVSTRPLKPSDWLLTCDPGVESFDFKETEQ